MKLKKFLEAHKMRRRDFLFGAGTLIGLPFLESLYPRKVYAQTTSSAPLRVLHSHLDMGVWQSTYDANSQIPSRVLATFDPIKEYFTNYRGVYNPDHRDHNPAEHYYTHGGSGTSFDHHAYQITGQGASPNVLSLRSYTNGSDSTESNLSISRANNVINSSLTNINDIVGKLFPSGGNTGTPDEPDSPQQVRRTSSLHYVVDSLKTMNRNLSSIDKIIVDRHLTAIEEIESLGNGGNCPPFQNPGNNIRFDRRCEALAEMIAMAFTCDLRRSISLSHGDGWNPQRMEEYIPSYQAMVDKIVARGLDKESDGRNRSYKTPAYHTMTHNYDSNVKDREGRNILSKGEIDVVRQDMDIFFLSLYVKVAQRLKDTQDVDGKNVLENSLIYVGSDMGNPIIHSADNVLSLTIGKAGGKVMPAGGTKNLSGRPSAIAFQNALLDALGSTDTNKYSNRRNELSQINAAAFR